MKRFVKVKSGKIVDTTLLLPHVECYLEEDGKLYCEFTVDGSKLYLGIIVKESETMEGLL